MYLSCLAFLGYVLFARRRGLLPFGYLPLVVLALLVPGAFAATLAGGFHAYRVAAGLVGLLLLAAASGEVLYGRLRTRPPAARDSQRSASAKPPCRKEEWPVEAGLFAFALLALPWYYRGVTLRYYDEFFWGNLLKALLTDDRLLGVASPLSGTGIPLLNPPGPALLEGLFMPFGFDETAMAVGGMALVLSLGSLVLHLMRPRLGLFRALFLAVLCCCLARCLGTLHEGIYLVGYADYLQATAFAALLATLVFEPDGRRRLTVLLPGLALLTLFKATGFLFGMGIIVCAVAAAWDDPTAHPATGPSLRLSRLRSTLGLAVVLAVPIVLTRGLWTWHLQTFVLGGGTDVAARMAADAAQTLTRLGAEALSAGGPAAVPPVPASPETATVPPLRLHWEAFKALVRAFYSRALLLSPVVPESVMTVAANTLSLLLQWGAALLLMTRLTKTRLSPIQRRVLPVLLAGLAGWIAVRYLVSVQGHTPAEALRAASYERYIGAYMAGCAVLVTLIFHHHLARIPGRAARLSAPLLAAQTVLVLALCGLLPPSRPGDVPPGPTRAGMEQALALLEARTPPGSRIWFIEQNTDNRNTWALRYLAAPQRLVGLPPDTWSLGAPYNAEDRYSRPLDPAGLRDRARELRLDYLLLWRYDDRFLQQYGPVLGLDGLRDGLLLDLRDWREGRAALPAEVPAPTAP